MKKIKKQLKKLRKWAEKKWEKIKDHLLAQAYYAKHASQTALEVAKCLTLAAFILLTSFSANLLHEQYIEAHVSDSVVFIRSPLGAEHQGMATGFEVKAPSGKIYTLTNAHVCDLQKDGYVLVWEKLHANRLIPKRVIEVYSENDLCLVEGLDNYPSLTLANDISVSQLGWAIGYPMGQGLNISKGRVKEFGVVSVLDPEDAECSGPHKRKIEANFGFFESQICVVERYAAATDVPTYPGNSGSPLVNMYGNVIGIIFASNSETHWGDAVPVEVIRQFLKAY